MEPKVKNGQFTWFYRNGNKRMYNFFKNDSLLIFEEFNEAGKSLFGRISRKECKDLLTEAEKQKLGFVDVIGIDEPAEFPGGNEKLLEYIQSNLIYPQEAVDKKMHGRVIVTFTVSKSGRIKNVKTPFNVYPVMEREARRLVISMPKWKPGKNHGEVVEDKQAIPIVFILSR
jgi:TonB family protein